MSAQHVLEIEFCGEEYTVAPGQEFIIGRAGDLVVDSDNIYLHRQLVQLDHDQGFWWVRNVGSRLAVTITGEVAGTSSTLAPGGRLPVVQPSCSLLFTAGSTTYEVGLGSDVATVEPVPVGESDPTDEAATRTSSPLSAGQFLLVVGLCEHALRRVGSGAAEIPTNQAVARRLGWSITTFNRRLDAICQKLDKAGVPGLRGGPGRNAVGRRSRLVEYALAVRMVRAEHLALLDESTTEGVSS